MRLEVNAVMHVGLGRSPHVALIRRQSCFDAAEPKNTAAAKCAPLTHAQLTMWVRWEPKAPPKIREVTLMRPIHGNL